MTKDEPDSRGGAQRTNGDNYVNQISGPFVKVLPKVLTYKFILTVESCLTKEGVISNQLRITVTTLSPFHYPPPWNCHTPLHKIRIEVLLTF